MKTMDCSHVTEILPWFVNGTLDDQERRGVEEHLGSCEGCRQELEDTHFAGSVFGRHPPPEALVDYGFGRKPQQVDAAVLEEHLALCPKCSAELELVRESAWRSHQDADRVLPFAPRPRTAPRWNRAALAAGIAGLLAAGGMGWQLHTALRELEGPVVNVMVADAYPAAVVSRDRERPAVLSVPAGTQTLVLLLQAPGAEVYPAYELEVADASGELLYLEKGLRRQAEGDFTVSLRTAGLPRELTLRILGRRGEERREIARYFLAPQPAAAGE